MTLLALVTALAIFCIVRASPLDGTHIAAGAPKPLANLSFEDGDGLRRTLADYPGRLRIVHLWATWCAPCVAELPEVDALAGEYGPKGAVLLAIALEGGGTDKVKQFFAVHHITHLAAYHDGANAIISAAHVRGLPTTLFVSAAGEEIARAEGMVNWSDPNVKAFIEEKLQGK